MSLLIGWDALYTSSRLLIVVVVLYFSPTQQLNSNKQQLDGAETTSPFPVPNLPI